jgi:thiol-disulfide isomerase/thioredoxin
MAVACATLAAAPAAPEPEVVLANLQQVREAIAKPGARAVLVNVWATFCDPCREEMPDLLRVYRERRDQGLRLVLVSADADDDQGRAEARKYLASLGVDFRSYLKTGDDMAFINGIEPRWSGALPASFLFDGAGKLRHFFPGQVTAATLAPRIDALITGKRLGEKTDNGRTR